MKYAPRFLARFSFRPKAIATDSATARIFNTIFEQNLWLNDESVSGLGSTLARTGVIRQELPGLLASLGVTSLLDAPCGDYNWLRLTNLKLKRYVGIDIVPGLVERNRRLYPARGREFTVADIIQDKLPHCQAVLCRDCLIHLTSQQIFSVLKNFQKSGARYLLATNHMAQETYKEIATG